MTPTLLAVALTIGAPALKDPPKKDPPVVGRWQATALSINGAVNPQHAGLEYEFTSEGKWIIYRDGMPLGGVDRTFTADVKAKPAAIDLCESADGYAMPGVYKVEGDVLTLSFNISKGNRPPGFEASAEMMNLSLTRVKAK
jgi:uncharacterized protein (TIGR03067 family)